MMVDIHLHTYFIPGLPRNDQGDNYASPEELIAVMDRTGVDKGILLPGASPECRTQQTTPPELALEVVSRYPDRFYAFCNVDPRAEKNDPEADLSRHLVYYKERGCKGVGEITANLYFDDPLVFNLFRHCRDTRMPVLFHMAPRQGGYYGLVDDLGLPRLEKALAAFPDLPFLGHSQPFWAEVSGDLREDLRNRYPPGPVAPGGAVPRLLEEYPNLYGDLSAGSGFNAVSRDPDWGCAFLDRFQDRLLLGTDICSPKNDMQHAPHLRRLRDEGRLSEEAFDKIAWRNADRLLGLGLGG